MEKTDIIQTLKRGGQMKGEAMRKNVWALISLLMLVCLLTGGCGEKNGTAKVSEVDVDLTAMNDIIRYSYAYNMVYGEPEKYVGQTVKAVGPYVCSYYDVTGLNYHYLQISGDGSCCVMGMEFKEDDKDTQYAEDTVLEVIGTLEAYEELGTTYYYLAHASVKEV